MKKQVVIFLWETVLVTHWLILVKSLPWPPYWTKVQKGTHVWNNFIFTLLKELIHNNFKYQLKELIHSISKYQSWKFDSKSSKILWLWILYLFYGTVTFLKQNCWCFLLVLSWVPVRLFLTFLSAQQPVYKWIYYLK